MENILKYISKYELDEFKKLDWSANGTFICYFLRNRRRKFYHCFSSHEEELKRDGKCIHYPHFKRHDFNEASRVLVYSYIEWYHFIPLVNQWFSGLVAGFYKEILSEQIERGDLKKTLGHDIEYIVEVVLSWSRSPTLVSDQHKKLSDILLSESNHFLLHPIPSQMYQQYNNWRLHHKRYLQQGVLPFDFSVTGRAKAFDQCIYCAENAPCQADVTVHGPCTEGKNRFRCNKKAGVHLCNKHGHQCTLRREDRIKESHTKESAFENLFHLKDGRKVPNLGLLRHFMYLENDEKCAIVYEGSSLFFGMYVVGRSGVEKVHPLYPLGIENPKKPSFNVSYEEDPGLTVMVNEFLSLEKKYIETFGGTDELYDELERAPLTTSSGCDAHVHEIVEHAKRNPGITSSSWVMDVIVNDDISKNN